MAQTKKMEAPRWWWFDSHNKGSSRSPWLQSTLSELDDKTKTMLKLIEEDADSFAQRAEMYYKKRPELISLVQDLYRSHRSLAERYDQAKTDTGTRILGSSFSSSMRSNSGKTMNVMEDITNDGHSDAYDSKDNAESEIDDPKHDVVREDEILKLKEEIERLKEENKIQRAQLMQKDTEKIQVIRQLSWSVQELKDDNMELKKIIAKPSTSSRKWSLLEFSRSKGGFLKRLFNGSLGSRAAA